MYPYLLYEYTLIFTRLHSFVSQFQLTYVAGEFDFVAANDSNHLLHRVFTPLNKSNEGEFSLNVQSYLLISK